MTKFTSGNTRASKLSGIQVYEIREKWNARTHTQDALSREYQVSIGTIRNIVRGVTWQNRAMPQQSMDEQALAIKISQDRLLALLQADEKPARSDEKAEKAELPEELKPKKPNPYV
jgi:hypothetical protein